MLHPPVEEEWEWRVSDLIDWRTNTWDRETVAANFHRSDAEAILRIPLSHRYVPDMVFWLHTKNRDYSVKSGYHIARLLSKQEADMGESSREAMGNLIWAKLWKLKIPNKIRVFGWRACLDILPTWANFARRKILTDDRCGVCLQAKESGYHVLWECRLAQDVCAGCSRRLQKGLPGFDDMLQLVEHMQQYLMEEELEFFWVQCWFIWNQRNVVVHGGVIQEPGRLNLRANDYLEEFRVAQE